jgi:hypothetical protein
MFFQNVVAISAMEYFSPEVPISSSTMSKNYNHAVDKLVDSALLKRILAQTEIRYSNSSIESWWRVIKHQWLCLNMLDSVASVRKLVAFKSHKYCGVQQCGQSMLSKRFRDCSDGGLQWREFVPLIIQL